MAYISGSTGVLSPGMEARIVRDDGMDANTGEPGELWLRGNTVAMGYLNNKKATKATFIDGWLRTGDKFRVDAGGNFWSVFTHIYFSTYDHHSYTVHVFRFADRAKVSFASHAIVFKS